ncbi:MAG: bile acid:sodium symporter [Bdellovibrio sp.]|nr:bile acid:sodium symporter [Bdellovibrio sp.]
MILIQRVNHFVHQHLLKLLVAMYAIAVVLPKAGVAIKNAKVGTIHWVPIGSVDISLPIMMLAFLLFNAGLSVNISSLRKVFLAPVPLLVGLVANLLVPLCFTLIFAALGKVFWHNPDEIQNILVGLAIIASMPIAGSSTAWVQSSGGNPALILGLVLLSTVMSPILSPVVYHSIGFITTGDYSEDLHEIASQGASSFLIVSVVIPSLLGIGLRTLMSNDRWLIISPFLKMASLLCLLVLNYSNAAVSLPMALKVWDLDFFVLIALTTLALCALSFYLGWRIPKLLRISDSERISLTYGLGMSNNGTGLVLASTTMADHPLVMLPIIVYNLGQQIVGGIFSSKMVKREK